ncbi:MAG: aminotransferase class IV [Phycisphaerales bacterium]|nr:aminotransferase class IV [Phycisphaerales bacterium]
MTAAPKVPAPQPGYERGAAYLDGAFMPVGQAAIPILDAGYRRSDVTYDVVGVWGGSFFRLDDHLRRFRASMTALHMEPDETDAQIATILHRMVALAGLRNAYVSMECLRGAPKPGLPRHPANCRSYLCCHAVNWLSVATDEMFERGVHLIISTVRRIPSESVDPTVKNFHWGDLTRSQFEARAAGADNALLLDAQGNLTEGPGFNVFCVRDGVVSCPARGALKGITQASVHELCDELGLHHETRDIPAEECREADEIFICTTAGGIMPVSRIDGRILTNDRPGPISTRLKDLFWSKRAQGWHATPVRYDEVGERVSG